MEEWKYKAWLFQQEMFRILGGRKWDDLNGNSKNLEDKLDAAFGVCFGVNYCDKPNIKNLFENVKLEAIKLFEDKKYSENFSCTFIDWRNLKDDNAGRSFVIWLQKSNGSEICLDLNCRSYESWDEFLENNVLPKCHIIYPKCGRYSSGSLKDDFIEVEFEESNACSVKAAFKSTLDTVAMIGGIVSAGVLIFNPISGSVLIGAAAVSVATGGYNIGNSISRLHDIHKHDGGLAMDSKTLLAIGELAVGAAGTVAVGAAAGMKAMSSVTGTLLSEGTLAYRLANNVSQITRIVSGVNAGFYVLVTIDKYNREGKLTYDDLKQLVKVLFFSLNAIVSPKVLSSAVKYLAESFCVDRIIDYCIRSQNLAFQVVKRVSRFIQENEIDALIKSIFPDFKVYIEKITNIVPLIQRTSCIVDRTFSALAETNFDLNYIYHLQKELLLLWNEFCHYKKDYKKAIEQNYDKETLNSIESWTKNDAIDLPSCLDKIQSKFDCKINTPVEMQKKVKETIKINFGRIDTPFQLEKREKNLYSELLKLIKKHELRDNEYVLNKINFYCTYFNLLFSKLMELFHYEHFSYRINRHKNMIRNNFFSEFYYTDNIYENCYQTAVKLLKENIQEFHENFESNFTSSEEKQKRQLFELDMNFNSPELTEDDFYQKAKSLIPRLEVKLNNRCTTFDYYDSTAIIKSNENDFALFFYQAVIENNHAIGILLLVEDIVD